MIMIYRYVEVFRSSAEEMDHSFYAARGIPPPSSGPVPLRGISPTLDFRFRDRSDSFTYQICILLPYLE